MSRSDQQALAVKKVVRQLVDEGDHRCESVHTFREIAGGYTCVFTRRGAELTFRIDGGMLHEALTSDGGILRMLSYIADRVRSLCNTQDALRVAG